MRLFFRFVDGIRSANSAGTIKVKGTGKKAGKVVHAGIDKNVTPILKKRIRSSNELSFVLCCLVKLAGKAYQFSATSLVQMLIGFNSLYLILCILVDTNFTSNAPQVAQVI